MKNKKMSLRIKLTFTSIVILTSMCILLTMTAIYSASFITNSVNSLLPEDSQYIQEPTNSYAAASTTQSTEAATKTFRINNITVMFILIVVGSYMTYYFSSKALKPLEKLNDKINRININNLNVNIALQNTGNEIDQLTQSFNTMTSKLHNSYMLQKNFSANAAHELRTPLAIIQTKIDVFKMKKRSIEEYDEFLATIEENTVRLSAIVQGLLNFTNEQVVDMSQQVNIKEIVEEVLYELEGEASRNNIDISLKGNNTVVNGNDGLLQQAIYNLIENAIKYNNKNGKIEVEILQKDNNIILRVSDTGIGIPDEMKERVFQPLFRVDESRSRDIAGSGLGLAIVKNIIEKHGGIIKVEDNIPQGTCFEVIFKDLR